MGLKPENVPQLTLNNGMKIPCIGLGTFGSDRVSAEDVAAAVGGAIRCGYRLIDVYGYDHYLVHVKCQRCKFNDVVDTALFRTMRKNKYKIK